VVEEMYSLRHAYETTGDITLFDRLEWVAFNSMPATTDKDWTGNSHYHAVNQISAHGTTGYSPFNGCCTGNVHQGWPKFIMSGVQTVHGTAETSIVVSGYSPQEATLKDGTLVTLGGQYPFADNVTITIKPPAARDTVVVAAWSLALRIPCWVDSASVALGGPTGANTARLPMPATPCSLFHVPADALRAAAVTAADESGSVTLTLSFGHSIKVLTNKWSHGNGAPEAKFQHPAGAVEIHRGPLLFTFPLPAIGEHNNALSVDLFASSACGVCVCLELTESVIVDREHHAAQ
jgi:hypothetical protein